MIPSDTNLHAGLATCLFLPFAACLAFFVYMRFFYVDFGPIPGIPEIPGGSPLHGHLYLLGRDHASTAERWAQQFGWPLYQVRLGYRRVVFLNGFEAAREWLVTRQSCTIDRPWLYTFHGVVSKTSGVYLVIITHVHERGKD